jgi:tyrosine-protein kinase Etk/Wzc
MNQDLQANQQSQPNFFITKSVDKAANISLKELFAKYAIYIPLIILCSILALTLAWIKLRYTQTTYKQTGRLYLKTEENKNTNDQLKKLMLGDESSGNLENEIEILKSKELLLRVIENMNFRSRCYTKGTVIETENYPNVPFLLIPVSPLDSLNNDRNFEIEFEANAENLKTTGNKIIAYNGIEEINGVKFVIKRNDESVKTGKYVVTYSSLHTQAQSIASGLAIGLYKPQTTILNISHTSSNPAQSCDIINNLMQQYKLLGITEKSTASQKKGEFISSALTKVTARIDSIENAIASFSEKNNIIDLNTQSSSALAKSDEFSKEIAAEAYKLTDLEWIESILKDDNKFERIPPSLSISDPILGASITGYNSKVAIYQNAQNEGNPSTIRLKADLKASKREIVSSLQLIKASILARKNSIDEKFNKEVGNISNIPKLNKEYFNLTKSRLIDREISNYLYKYNFENDLSLVSTEPNCKVLEPARIDITPVSPIKRNVYAIALICGLLIPFLFIYLSELVNDKIDSRYEVERLTNVPVIGEIGNAGDDTVLLPQSSRKIVAEQLRLVRSNLNMMVKNKEKPSVLFTSSVSGEGKSFISLNLANSIAASGKKVAVFEMDLRKPKISERLKLKFKKGFTNFILGEATMEEIFFEIPGHKNLFLVPSGPVPPNPSELLMDDKFKALFAYVKEKVDYIVIDTAPVGLISDALILNQYADATIYVVRDEYTIKKNIEIINEMQEGNRLPNLSIVINDIKEQKKYGGYKYGGYYYKSYSKNYNVEDNTLKPTFIDNLKSFFIKKA